MAIHSSSSEWLSTNIRKPVIMKHNSKKKNNKPIRSQSPLREISFLQLSSQSSKRNIHQTRVSTYFKKRARKKKITVPNDNLLIVDDNTSASSSHYNKSEQLEDCIFSCTNEEGGAVIFNDELLPKHVSYDEEALFGICGDSLCETSQEVVDLEESLDDNVQKDKLGDFLNFNVDGKSTDNNTKEHQDFFHFKDSEGITNNAENQNDAQLSPCVISKYKKTSRTMKKENKGKSYFKPIDSTNFSIDAAKRQNCVRKLSLCKQKKENLYETKMVPDLEEEDMAVSGDDFSQSCVSSLAFSDVVMTDSVDTLQSESMRKCIGDILHDSDVEGDETAESYGSCIGSQETFGTCFSSL